MSSRTGCAATWLLALLLTGCGAGGDDGAGGGTTGGTGSGVGGMGGGTGGDVGTTGGAFPTGGAGGGSGGTPPATGPCVPGTAYAQPNLGGAVPTAVFTGSGSGLFEGPVWIAQLGALFFSDMTFSGSVPPSDIHWLAPPSAVSPFVTGSGSNGLAVNGAAQIVACTHDTQSLSIFDPSTGARTVWVGTYQGLTFNSPNDLTIHPNGTVFFSDPDWQLGGRPNATGMTGVYRVTTASEVFLVDGTLNKPNGVALSPDGSVLYVGDYSGRVGTYPVLPDGSTGARNEFAAGIVGPDGMTVDCSGNLYVASHDAGQIRVFAPSGQELGQIPVAASLTNLAFGGADGMTLYESDGKTLYAIPMNLPGLPY